MSEPALTPPELRLDPTPIPITPGMPVALPIEPDEPEPGASLPPVLRAMRPLQWTKNLVVFAALVFSQSVFDLQPLLQTIGAFIAFCMVSSSVYLVNDLRDVEQDRIHPSKRFRPIAAGELEPRLALGLAVILASGGLMVAVFVRPELAAVTALYLVMMLAYTLRLKQVVILDVIIIALGFVLRAAGGAVAIDVPISPWLYICTLLLALLLGFGKRRHELLVLQDAATLHRENLEVYSVNLLDQIIAVTAAATVVAYSIYTFETPALPDSHAMMLTIPFVIYAVFRYLFLLYRKHKGGSPEVILYRDRPLQACLVAWAATSLAILYFA